MKFSDGKFDKIFDVMSGGLRRDIRCEVGRFVSDLSREERVGFGLANFTEIKQRSNPRFHGHLTFVVLTPAVLAMSIPCTDKHDIA